jgi:hypothetical protein
MCSCIMACILSDLAEVGEIFQVEYAFPIEPVVSMIAGSDDWAWPSVSSEL